MKKFKNKIVKMTAKINISNDGNWYYLSDFSEYLTKEIYRQIADDNCSPDIDLVYKNGEKIKVEIEINKLNEVVYIGLSKYENSKQ